MTTQYDIIPIWIWICTLLLDNFFQNLAIDVLKRKVKALEAKQTDNK